MTALSVFRKKDVDLLQSMAGRYLRLFPVVAGATFFSFVLMKTGLMYHLNISNSVRNTDFLLGYCNFLPTLRNLLSNSIFQTYVNTNIYVGPFWTIPYEFIGYFWVVILCSATKGKKCRRILYVIVTTYLWWQGQLNYCTFILGAFVADLFYYTDSNTTWLSCIYTKLVRHKAFLIPFYILGTYLACIPMSQTGIYRFWPSLIEVTLYRAAGIAMCLWCILNCRFAQKILEIKPIQWLGKMSFTTYAFHWPIMLSLEAGVFMLMINKFTYNFAALGAFMITIPCILLVSYLMWRLLEDNGFIYNMRKFILGKLKI